MIDKNIENITQLRIEYSRLQELRVHQEEQLLNDLKEIKNNSTPLKIIFNLFSARKKPAKLLINGLVFGLSFLAGRMFLKKKESFPKSIATSLIRSIPLSVFSAISFPLFKRVIHFYKSKKKNATQLDVMKEKEENNLFI